MAPQVEWDKRYWKTVTLFRSIILQFYHVFVQIWFYVRSSFTRNMQLIFVVVSKEIKQTS